MTGNVEKAAQIIADAINNLAAAIRGNWWMIPPSSIGTVPYPVVPVSPGVPIPYPNPSPTSPTWQKPYVGDPPGWLDTNKIICSTLSRTATGPAVCQADGDGLSHTD